MQNIFPPLTISSFRNFALIISLAGLADRSNAHGSFEKIYGTSLYNTANAIEKTSHHQGYIITGLNEEFNGSHLLNIVSRSGVASKHGKEDVKYLLTNHSFDFSKTKGK